MTSLKCTIIALEKYTEIAEKSAHLNGVNNAQQSLFSPP